MNVFDVKNEFSTKCYFGARLYISEVDFGTKVDPTNTMIFVFLGNKIQKMKVPVVYLNNENSVGVKKGGYFNTVRRFLTILCPVENLPRKIEIDTIDMPIGKSIKAKEAVLPEGAKLLDNPEFVIASIVGKKGKADVEAEETATAAPAAKSSTK
jgi:large subunit ribosomal protein L25